MCAQVLASIGQLEFFYDQAPDVMRSCSMALQLLSVAIGSYLSGAVVLGVSYITDALGCDWLPQDLNYGRLDLFFLLLAGAPACMHEELLCRIMWAADSYWGQATVAAYVAVMGEFCVDRGISAQGPCFRHLMSTAWLEGIRYTKGLTAPHLWIVCCNH